MLRILLFFACSLVCTTTSLLSAEVDSDVSTRETFVGLPIVLRININNAVEHETPIMPDVDGLQIELVGPPSRSSQTRWINGRKSERTTVSYAFRVTPLREGTFTIPPVKVVADGLASITKAVRVVASKSETDDLMFVEIEGSETEIFVGQALDLKLKLWVRPYRNTDYKVDLDEGDMWASISEQTAWGPFQKRLDELAKNRQRPGGIRVLRTDSTGQEREYFLYEIETTLYPDRPTTIDGQDVRIILNYPIELGRSRSPFPMFDDDDFFGGSLFDNSPFGSFGGGLAITKARPIVGVATLEPIRVKPVPTQGRPGDYVGAVGQYSIIAEATPQSVEVGEPITLHVAIDGTGSMDVVRAPPLAVQRDLVRDFKVADEPLAGFIDGARKVFTTTIRPLREDVTEIPPIEYTYFDPETEQFVTTKSKPIPIEVKQADMLALNDIVGNRGSGGRGNSGVSTATSEPAQTTALKLFSGSDVLASVQRPGLWSPRIAGALLVPPAIFLVALAFAFRALPGSLIPARRRFRKAIERAASAADVATALEVFLASHFRLAPSRLIRDQTIGSLRAEGRHELAIRVDRLYHAESRGETSLLQERKQEAESIVAEACEAHWPSRPRIKLAPLRSTGAMIGIALLASPLAATPMAQAASFEHRSLELTPDQQQQLLGEGIAAFETASGNPDPIEASDQYREAADKFQLLIDSGINNDRLYFNLAEAAIHSDQRGRAIANYRRALRLKPDNKLYHERLAFAEKAIGITQDDRATLLAKTRHINDAILRWISPTSMLVGFIASWLAFWSILSWRVVRPLSSWRAIAGLALTLAIVCGSSYLLRVTQFTQDRIAVLLASSISIRTGDGVEFAEQAKLSDRAGHEVRVLEQRGDWLHVTTDSGQQGWIHSDDCAVI